MCGIVGILGQLASIEAVRSMSDAIIHRGPDDGGVWIDMSSAIALGHRRLAVVDISPAGRQPMHSYCHRYVIVFN